MKFVFAFATNESCTESRICTSKTRYRNQKLILGKSRYHRNVFSLLHHNGSGARSATFLLPIFLVKGNSQTGERKRVSGSIPSSSSVSFSVSGSILWGSAVKTNL